MISRAPWAISGVLASLLVGAGVVTGCTQPTPPSAPSPKAADAGAAAKATTAPTPVTATAPPAVAASPKAAPAPAESKAASPVAAAAPRGEPKGKLTYLFNTSLTPDWLDPQGNAAVITPYIFQYALHDAVVKNLPGKPLAPSLAESYEMAADGRSAIFKLREGIRFHNGEPVTSEDVKFTFEKYKGAGAKQLQDKTERIETPDARTVRFVFKEPFIDFLVLYGTPATGAGWVVPKKYYEQVGPDGFKQKPIGAGPYKFVRQVVGSEFEFEAVPDYWRKSPSVKTLVIKGVTEDATRLAALQTGEADLNVTVQGILVDTVRKDPNLKLGAVLVGSFWIEMPGFEKPESPFNNSKARHAVSLILNRQAINEAEHAGFSPLDGNWIPPEWPGSLSRPTPDYNPARAKQLMAEVAPNGFDVEQLTPFPPYYSLAERIITALREIGVRTRLNQMERAAFLSAIAGGRDALPGMLLNYSSQPGDAAGRIRTFATCSSSSSRVCVAELDTKIQRYDATTDLKERETLLNEIQAYLLDNYIMIPLYRHSVVTALGPRIANDVSEIAGAIPQFGGTGPWEDIRLKE